MESLKDTLIHGIEKAFPNRFTILEKTISYDLKNGYSAILISNVQLYHTKQPLRYGSATCVVNKNNIYIISGYVNNIVSLLSLIR